MPIIELPSSTESNINPENFKKDFGIDDPFCFLLRSDNADQRITPLGIEIGCVSNKRADIFSEKIIKIKKGFNLVKKLKTSPNQLAKKGIKINHDGKKRSLIELLSFSNISFSKLEQIWPEIKKIDRDTKEQIEIMRQAYDQRRNLFSRLIKDIPDINYIKPNGAFYAFIDVRNILSKLG